jgi:ribosomal protein L32
MTELSRCSGSRPIIELREFKRENIGWLLGTVLISLLITALIKIALKYIQDSNMPSQDSINKRYMSDCPRCGSKRLYDRACPGCGLWPHTPMHAASVLNEEEYAEMLAETAEERARDRALHPEKYLPPAWEEPSLRSAHTPPVAQDLQ